MSEEERMFSEEQLEDLGLVLEDLLARIDQEEAEEKKNWEDAIFCFFDGSGGRTGEIR